MPSRAAMLDTILCLLAVLGLGCTLVPDYRHVASIEYVATDFKTLYASATLLAQHHDPYSLAALPAIFRRDFVIEPATWFSRSPVYPPATLALVAPLTRLPMARAAVAWFALSLAAYAAALALVLTTARHAGLTWPWRMAILALAVANPMLAYALEVGNASVMTSALAIAAWMLVSPEPAATKQWILPALLLGLAVLLKPHLAFWIVLGLLLFAGNVARKIALTAILIGALYTGASALWLAAQGLCVSTFRSYAGILAVEHASGSMSAASRELLPLPAQITAAQAIFGLVANPALSLTLTAVTLAILAAALVYAATRPTPSPILGVAAVAAFGLVATYHRAHDSLILLPLLVWIATLIAKSKPRTASAWKASVAVLVLLLCLWVPFPGRWFALRQAALILVGLTSTLAIITWNQEAPGKRQKKAA